MYQTDQYITNLCTGMYRTVQYIIFLQTIEPYRYWVPQSDSNHFDDSNHFPPFLATLHANRIPNQIRLRERPGQSVTVTVRGPILPPLAPPHRINPNSPQPTEKIRIRNRLSSTYGEYNRPTKIKQRLDALPPLLICKTCCDCSTLENILLSPEPVLVRLRRGDLDHVVL